MRKEEKDVCNKSTFREVFMAHSEELRDFLYYRCGQLQQAEDHLQECFVRLWNNCAKVPFAKAKGFLFTVGNNLFLNEVKHRKVVLRYRQQVRPQEKDDADPQQLLEYQEFKARLKEAVEDLPEGQRTVFLLNRTNEKTYKEIAEMLEISVKAVEKRMHKALLQLRNTLQPKEE
ncbi:MAG: sigma-70 family RNA polymerase sigma factor [Bacteroidota bacterium]